MSDDRVIDGRFEITESLGKGSFAHTFAATERETGRRVAIKVLHPPSVESWKAYDLFAREAHVLGELRHQGIPAVYESFRATWKGADTAFLVMEFVEGPTLEQLIVQGRSFTTDEVRDLVLRMADILEYLHERVPAILHRDIKPANVILRNGKTPVLVDFGAVRNVFRAPDETGSTVVGTYGYMPYEQYMGQATPASDLYALGATMLHLLTGRPPSEFLTDQGRLEVPAHLPGGTQMSGILTRLLAPAAANRFQTALELRHALLDPPDAAGNRPLPAKRPNVLPGVERAEALLARLGDAPRMLQGAPLEQFKKTVPSAIALMGIGSSIKPGKRPTVGSYSLFVFLSVISMGVVPVMYWLLGKSQKQRLRPFFINGLPAVGEIQTIELGRSPFGERATRVTYEFEAEGQLHRGADQVLTVTSDRWRVGDAIAVLYLPNRDYDSVIVSTF